MTDKEKIRAELEKLCIKYNEAIANPNFASYEAMLIAKGKQRQREDILNFINSLPEESTSDDLEKEINRYFDGWTFDDDLSIMCNKNGYPIEKEDLKDIIRYFSEWQKEQMMKGAIEGDILNSYYPTHIQLNTYSKKFNDGEKVKVIIIKEDQS